MPGSMVERTLPMQVPRVGWIGRLQLGDVGVRAERCNVVAVMVIVRMVVVSTPDESVLGMDVFVLAAGMMMIEDSGLGRRRDHEREEGQHEPRAAASPLSARMIHRWVGEVLPHWRPLVSTEKGRWLDPSTRRSRRTSRAIEHQATNGP